MAYDSNVVVANNIKRLREIVGLTQSELAEVAGVSENAISKWEHGKAIPRMGAIERMSACYGIGKTSLLEPDGLSGVKVVRDMMSGTTRIVRKTTGHEMVEVPLYGSIAAGTPIDMVEVEDSYPIPRAVHDRYPDAFLLKVVGNSMDRILPNGCYALVDPCPYVEHDMQPYAVAINGDSATIKRVRRLANGFELLPDSSDPTYRPKVYDFGVEGTDTVTVIGRVTWDCKPVNWTY